MHHGTRLIFEGLFVHFYHKIKGRPYCFWRVYVVRDKVYQEELASLRDLKVEEVGSFRFK